jgi:hypothetical protein
MSVPELQTMLRTRTVFVNVSPKAISRTRTCRSLMTRSSLIWMSCLLIRMPGSSYIAGVIA